MSKISVKSKKLKHHFNRGFRFALTGIVNTGIHAIVAILCLNGFFFKEPLFVVGPVGANSIAFTFATMFSYFANTKWSFATEMNRRNFLRFIVVSLFGLFFTMCLSGLTDYFNWPPIISVVLVVCFMPIINFMLHTLWTYRNNK